MKSYKLINKMLYPHNMSFDFAPYTWEYWCALLPGQQYTFNASLNITSLFTWEGAQP